jgi:hypothetical protein
MSWFSCRRRYVVEFGFCSFAHVLSFRALGGITNILGAVTKPALRPFLLKTEGLQNIEQQISSQGTRTASQQVMMPSNVSVLPLLRHHLTYTIPILSTPSSKLQCLTNPCSSNLLIQNPLSSLQVPPAKVRIARRGHLDQQGDSGRLQEPLDHCRHPGSRTTQRGQTSHEASVGGVRIDAEARRNLSDSHMGLLLLSNRGSSATNIEELRGLNAVELVDVHGGNGRPRIVNEAADITPLSLMKLRPDWAANRSILSRW